MAPALSNIWVWGGVVGDLERRLHFNCAYQDIWTNTEKKGAMCNLKIGKWETERQWKVTERGLSLQFSARGSNLPWWLSPEWQIALWATCEVSEVTCRHSSRGAMICTKPSSCLWFLSVILKVRRGQAWATDKQVRSWQGDVEGEAEEEGEREWERRERR